MTYWTRAALILCIASLAFAEDKLAPAAQRQAAPDFTLADANEKPITLSAYKGNVVLLDFWATWCGGCKQEIPWYVEFYDRYRPNGLAVIGVSMDDGGMAVVKPFLAPHHMDYPVVIGNENLASRYDLRNMPVTVLIDRSGRIAAAHAGIVDKQNFESLIKALLREHAN
jgi:peroxiredoxin